MLRRSTLCLTIGVIACSNSPFAHQLGDGGADAPFTHDGPGVDGRMHDAAPDAPSAGVVTIVVTVNGQPGSGATVYFQNADSSLVAESQTGSDGRAAQTMAPGGFVTLIEPPVNVVVTQPTTVRAIVPSNQNLDTFAGVKPGDVLLIDLSNGETVPPSVDFTMTVPTDGSAANYTLFSSCGEASLNTIVAESKRPRANPLAQGPANLSLQNCNGVADMLVVTSDANNNPLNEIYVPGVPVAQGSAVVLTQSYVPMSSQTVISANIPQVVVNDEDVGAEHDLIGPDGFLAELPDSGVVTNGNASIYAYPQPTGAALVSLVEQFYDGDGTTLLDDQTIGDWGPPSSATAFVDATAERLPDFSAAPTFDIATQQVQWQQTGGGSASIDGVFANMSFSRTIVGSDDSETTANWDWDIIVPGDEAGAVTFPTLPTDLFAWNAAAGDTTTVGFVEMGHVTGGYDAARPLAITFDFDAVALTTPSGHVVIDGTDISQPAEVARTTTKHRTRHSSHRGHARTSRRR